MDGSLFSPPPGLRASLPGCHDQDLPGGPETPEKGLVPDTAHGTNPASSSLCGYQVVR
jgi:hypothetical protein